MTVAGRNEAAEGTAGRRILFATENALGWNALLPIFIRLRQRTDITLSSIAVSYTVADAYKSWRFKSKELENIFRDLYVPADDVEVLAWDIFVVSHSLRIIDISPHQHIVSVPHGAGFGSGSYSLEKYSQSTLYSGFSPEEAGYIADHTGEPPPANRFIATGAPRNDRFAPFLGAPLAERTEKKRRLKSKALRRTSHWCWSRPTGLDARRHPAHLRWRDSGCPGSACGGMRNCSNLARKPVGRSAVRQLRSQDPMVQPKGIFVSMDS